MICLLAVGRRCGCGDFTFLTTENGWGALHEARLFSATMAIDVVACLLEEDYDLGQHFDYDVVRVARYRHGIQTVRAS